MQLISSSSLLFPDFVGSLNLEVETVIWDWAAAT